MPLLLLEIDPVLTVVMSLVVGAILWAGQSFLEHHLYVCGPNEVLVFSGRQNVNAQGEVVGYRVLKGGKSWRTPFLETCQRLSLRPLSVQRTRPFALADGQEQSLALSAEVKITPAEPGLTRAIERFLGCGSDEIADAAAASLEGSLGAALASYDAKTLPTGASLPAEVLDPVRAELGSLGLELVTLRLGVA